MVVAVVAVVVVLLAVAVVAVVVVLMVVAVAAVVVVAVAVVVVVEAKVAVGVVMGMVVVVEMNVWMMQKWKRTLQKKLLPREEEEVKGVMREMMNGWRKRGHALNDGCEENGRTTTMKGEHHRKIWKLGRMRLKTTKENHMNHRLIEAEVGVNGEDEEGTGDKEEVEGVGEEHEEDHAEEGEEEDGQEMRKLKMPKEGMMAKVQTM